MPLKISEIALRLGVFLIAGIIAYAASLGIARLVEERSVVAVREALIDAGHDWASVLGDGLQVILEGEAPSEAYRFRAMATAGGIVDASRVIDNMVVVDPTGLAAPDFSMEMLRNDSGVSLIGLVPSSTDREALSARIATIADGAPVADFLESADYPVPETWRAAMNFGLRSLEKLPRSKISVTANRVAITAISDSAGDKRRLESELAQDVPVGVRLALDISAPRPVITPYITRFTIDENGARFASCTADTQEVADKIMAAAVAAGMTGRTNCTLALGVPSKTWGDAVALSITALKDLGGGTLTISDADVTIVAREGTAQSSFDGIIGRLDNALPDLFALEATLPVAESATSEGPPEFSATLSPEGEVQLRGKVPDELMNTTTENYAQAFFGHDAVTMGTLIADGLPQGWSVRVLAGIDALSRMSSGSVTVTPDMIDVRGNTGNAEASAEISRFLVEKLGDAANFSVDVTYVKELDPIAGLPTPEECVAQISVVTEGRKITFDPGSATISADSVPLVSDIADVLSKCLDLQIEIAGYTDSQGGEEMNQQLSQKRAEAVLDALRARRIPVSNYTAVGYGEADPIADNETEAGREANRRIDFRLIDPAANQEPTGLEATEAPAGEAPAEAPAEDGQ